MRRICLTIILTMLTGCATVRNLTHGTTAKTVTAKPVATQLQDTGSAAIQQPAVSSGPAVDDPAGQADTCPEGQDDERERVLAEPGPHSQAENFQLASFAGQKRSKADASAAGLPTDETGLQPLRNDSSAAPPNAENAEQHAVQFVEVVDSVYRNFPLLQSALCLRNIALGQQVGAAGAFDLKLKGASENGPVGFYQSYRQALGVVQPTYWGGEVFAGYRNGRGDFQPWYLERQTNGGGEFKAGVEVPLARNRNIDARRAELWKAGYGRNLAEPDIQAQLIEYVQAAAYGYWDWVAAGENHRIAVRILRLAEERTARVEAQVTAGFVDPPELTDNMRMVSIRQAKVSDTRRKLQQTAAKLSIYWRDLEGEPIVPTEDQLPGFPEPEPVDDDQLGANIQQALSLRPELRMLDLLRQQIQVDYSEAVNQLQPEINAVLWGSQDVGEPTSSKRDKSPFESEASVFLDVPIQRRKAHGKITETQGKLAQLSAKRRLTADKVSVDVQMAHAALQSAWEQVSYTRLALAGAEDLATRERANQAAGASDLLKVSLREQYAVESAEKNVDALKLYFESLADYRAAMAQDQIDR